MKCVLVLAGGAPWESTALAILGRSRDFVVLKRCVDVADLMAAATTGQADLALVALEVPGLDLTAIDHLRRHRVRVVGIDADDAAVAKGARTRRVDVVTRLAAAEIDRVAEVLSADSQPVPTGAVGASPAREQDPHTDLGAKSIGMVIACWGPNGAPGRTTVAIGIAAELARRESSTLLIDADPWGGAVAQQLGVLDEVSGVLAASRLNSTRELAGRFAEVQRGLGKHLRVVTGLPRPDRWPEVRPGTIEQLCELGRGIGQVVLDTGFSLEGEPWRDGGSRPGRNTMTLAALDGSDKVVVVGSADPVGLARLARGLTELAEVAPEMVPLVVLNRMRPTLAWPEKEIAGLVSGFGRIEAIHVLPEDRRAVDAALVSGGFVTQGPLAKSIGTLVDVLVPESALPATRRALRRRNVGTAHPR